VKGVLAALLLAAVLFTGIRWGTFVAGGSDSYCYAHQAERWATLLRQGFGGQGLQVPEPLALDAPWPNAPLTFAPAGHVPSATVPGAIVPVCPAGLSIAMAPVLALGGRDAIFFVVPLFGVMLIAATRVAGARFGARVGLAAAVLTACSPAFLYQLVQPMSDVPAAALWVTAVAAATGTGRRSAALGGLATSGAVLIRPNLVPLGIPIGLFLLLRPERTWPERIRAAATYAAWSLPGCLAVAVIQQMLYGSALASGYGSLDVIFSAGRVLPNATRYFTWLTDTHTPIWMLAAVAPFLLPGALTRLLAAMVLVNVALYLPYHVFDDWSYLRFLLPAIPLVMILVVASIDALVRRAGPLATVRGTQPAGPLAMVRAARGTRPPYVVAGVTLVLGVLLIREAQARSAFRLQALEARYARGGEYVNTRLPSNALVITSWQSGSVRFYSGRKTLVWDSLDPAWLDRAVAVVRQRGFEPYLLFERWEESAFRRRFAGSPMGALDWPPMAEVATQVRVYRPEDRERYLRGDQPPTEYVR
jgi:hypothetical protein